METPPPRPPQCSPPRAAFIDIPPSARKVLRGHVRDRWIAEIRARMDPSAGCAIDPSMFDHRKAYVLPPLETYIGQIITQLHVRHPPSTSAIILSLCYLDQIVKYVVGLGVTRRNVHVLVSLSVLTASKFLDESLTDGCPMSNKELARCLRLDQDECLALERLFLARMHYDLHKNVATFDRYKKMLFEGGPAVSGRTRWRNCLCR